VGRGAAPAPQDRAAMRTLLAERRRAALRLNVLGWSYDRIAKESDLGYADRQAVYRDIKAGLAQAIKDQNIAAEALRAKHTLLLDEALQVAARIMSAEHVAHSGGRLVQREIEHPDGSVELIDVIDNGPNLAAARELRALSESQRKLWGIDAPTKTEATIDATVGYAVVVAPEELEQL
jgi:hypothetical protein